MVACDVYRPAAVEQLKVLGGQVGIPVYFEENAVNPSTIAENGVKFARENNHDVVIVDTAGRLAIDEQMMSEIKSIHYFIKPNETLFVVDSMTGQDAVNTAKTFNEALNFDGVVLTKLDGDTRGGSCFDDSFCSRKTNQIYLNRRENGSPGFILSRKDGRQNLGNGRCCVFGGTCSGTI